MSEWTYHAQDARTGAWLSRDLPLSGVEIVDVLTGHCSLKGAIVPEIPGMGPLEEFGTFIYAEKHNVLRFGGLLFGSSVAEDGQSLGLDVRGFTAYPSGQPYGGKFRLWSADPLDCVREVWSWLQARGRSNLGLVVDGDSSPVTISDVRPPNRPRRADVTYPPSSNYGSQGNEWPRPPKPRLPRRRKPRKRGRRPNETDAHWTAYVASFNAALEAWEADYDELNKNRLPEWRAWHRRLETLQDRWEEDYGDREPYSLSWWDNVDCGAELDRLAQEGGFDWRERHTWDGTGPDGKGGVNHRLQLGWPRIGVDHDDMVLVPGGDLASTPGMTRAGDRFANTVIGLGAGEGRKMRRVQVGTDDGRLMRVHVLSRKKVRRLSRLRAIARDERSYRTLLREIPEVAVWDTEGNLGVLRLGDVVPVQLNEGWPNGTTRHRIVGRRYRPDEDDVIYLQLVRAERSSS